MIDFLTLPGFSEIKANLEKKGYPSGWITEVVNTSVWGAVFVKDGHPWYKSPCIYYEGFWLYGGIGSVQCGAYGGLLPGLMWDTTCKGGFDQCPFCVKGEQHE